MQFRVISIQLWTEFCNFNSYSLTFYYPVHLLQFNRITADGTLTVGWDSSAEEAASGKISISGSISKNLGGIGNLVSGTLIKIIFEVKPGVSGQGNLSLRDFANGLCQRYTTRDGRYRINQPEVPRQNIPFSKTLTSFNLPSGSDVNNYRLISIPAQLNDPNPATIFEPVRRIQQEELASF